MRYKRQEVLEEIGVEGQRKLKAGKVVVVGLGALGTVTAQLLVRAGVQVTLIDHDVVDLVNLQRQLLYDENDVGKKKVVVCKEKLDSVNSEVEINVDNLLLSEENSDVLNGFDIILDCTDNMRTRHVINNHCMSTGQVWIYAAGSTTKGNVLVVDNPKKFKTFFRSGETFDKCSEVGVLNSLTTIIAGLQTTEALKILLGQEYSKSLIRFDIWKNRYDLIKL